MNVESEWDRIKNNPDNVIVSDELRELLDPKELGDVEQPPTVGYFVELTLQELPKDDSAPSQVSISGPLLSFSKNDKEICYTAALATTDAAPLIGGARLVVATIADTLETFTQTIEVDWEKDSQELFDLDFAAFGEIPSPTVLLTMSIPLSAE